MTDDIELGLLLDAIYRVYHYDFRAYSEASLKRRLSNALTHFHCDNFSRLQERVLREPQLFTELLRFLTVQVSDLFRDASYFRALRETVVPYLQTYASLKVWVAGCATGEEAYSIAILLAEEGLLDRTLIYATDINHAAGGRSSLSDYYAAAYGGAVMDRKLRKAIVFSDHSLATDTVFAEVQFASCRNVLIYFERQLQDRALGVIEDSLCRKGFLGLGSKETLRFSTVAAQFIERVPEARIYQKL